MPTGFRRGPNTVTGMSDPSTGVTPEHAAEMQENIRKLETRLADLERRPQPVVDVPRGAGLPIFEGRDGVKVVQTPKRVTIIGARDDRKVEASILFLEHPWKLYQEEADVPGLRISMLPGVLVRTSAASLYPLNTLVNYTPADAPDDAATVYWFRASVSKSAYQSYFEVWTVDSWAVETGSALPADTLDIPNDTAGDLHFKIGEVTTEDGEVTDIQQDLAAPVTVVFPLGLILDEFECPADEEEE
jgi:hypothetical protein